MIRAATVFSKRSQMRQVMAYWPSAGLKLDSGETEESEKHSVYTVSLPKISSDLGSRRQFSSSSGKAPNAPATDASVDETLNKLFQDSQTQIADAASSGDAWYAAAEQAVWEPVWYNFADQAVVAVKTLHDVSGLEYGWSIVGLTVFLRLGLFPIMVRAQQTTSRMAHLQPELTAMKNRYEALGTPSRQDQLQFSKNMKALFAKYQVKPFRAFLGPVIQLPLFMGMFFGLKKIGDIYPEELATGGMYWFTDLTATDPYYILPFASAASFLLLIELGKDQMTASNPAQGKIMLNVFRGLSLFMVPVCINFDAAMLCYWTSNNVLTIGQTALLKSPGIRKYFGIWEPPKPVPGKEAESITEVMGNLAKRVKGEHMDDKSRMEANNQAIEAKKKAASVLRSRSQR